jgi:hypothetical protein
MNASIMRRCSRHIADARHIIERRRRTSLGGRTHADVPRGFGDGSQCDWVKVKCPSWRERNRERWRLFERHEGSGRDKIGFRPWMNSWERTT